MRDWSSTLAPASIAGVSFRVRSDEIEAGRRRVVHEIPNGRHVVEEFGPRPREYDVTGYVAGDAADVGAAALLALDGVAGPVLLVLPTTSAMVAGVEIRRSFDRDRLGYVAVSIRAIDAGAVSAPGFGLAVGFGLTVGGLLATMSRAADLVFAGIGGMVSSLTATLGIATSPIASVLIGRIVDTAVTGLVVIEAVRAAAAAPALALLDDTEARASTAADFAAVALDVADLAERVAELIDAPETWADDMATAVRSIGDLAAPDLWSTSAASLVDLTADEVPIAWTSEATIAAAAAAAIVPAAIRVAALASVIEVTAARDFADRPSAVAARNRIVEAIAAEVERLDRLDPVPGDLIGSLTTLRDAAVAALEKRATTLAPVVTVRSTAIVPAIVWAWRLYGDPTRAGEIVARNRLDHPAFVPEVFEALAR